MELTPYVIAQANAFVLPGGKVFVFSGLLNMCGNDDALAAVLGHEIAHQTASHTAERLSQAWVGNLTTGALFFLVGTLPGLALFAIWTATGAFVLPALMYELPMSRTHEYEADHIGLLMMAEACYDPRAAIPFWQRMNHQGQQMDEVLSTHPSVRGAFCCSSSLFSFLFSSCSFFSFSFIMDIKLITSLGRMTTEWPNSPS